MVVIAAKKSNSAKLFGLGIKSKKAAASSKMKNVAFSQDAAFQRAQF
jgi:hypothetical protein